jgi:hypothetical protein
LVCHRVTAFRGNEPRAGAEVPSRARGTPVDVIDDDIEDKDDIEEGT